MPTASQPGIVQSFPKRRGLSASRGAQYSSQFAKRGESSMRLEQLRSSFGLCLLALLWRGIPQAQAQAPRFEVTIPASAHAGPLTGRLVLVVARSAQPEPRLAISPSGPAMFGVDLEQLEPGRPVVIDSSATAYPAPMSALPPGDYFAQAVINVYDRVQRADGKTLWLPMNDGT